MKSASFCVLLSSQGYSKEEIDELIKNSGGCRIISGAHYNFSGAQDSVKFYCPSGFGYHNVHNNGYSYDTKYYVYVRVGGNSDY